MHGIQAAFVATRHALSGNVCDVGHVDMNKIDQPCGRRRIFSTSLKIVTTRWFDRCVDKACLVSTKATTAAVMAIVTEMVTITAPPSLRCTSGISLQT
ncbi:MAG: hypothetical protein M0O96_12485 [Desulforhopalus sp.]|nr:hypothetical protein [Desulforhopalus sp.]